ncbi:hypothetical protein SAMN06266787_12416 [Halorubrum ezzemoulense]|uniref:Uncharacterized protein n=2 Tax=Halorubrum ezzemoulense TaxID=337243 RepID=A0A1X4GK71_HALEZ|nr:MULTISPECIES: hypothetical protein [Halorubrum]MDB2262401.1 hypothetical protein [Halorubrum ezzemoulense]MDB2269169.1 hypothetical protein [Halorubrum ezzemoulense]OSO97599.1 hypothetical protein B9H04_12335 [Halorubrum ezzemoulense DSM 17463]TKX37178.1 hypothetical protein EXE52_15435 [Halorubrum sp. CGM4_25_10-8A]TKX62499.1 hypothetical protein EXE47_15930 [Halorubrum sp. GN12_10-3_MGM]
MGGFKEGTVNGWEDEEEDDDEPEVEPASSSDVDSKSDQAETTEVEIETGASSSANNSGRDTARSDIPWILRRNSITDGREQTVQLHLQEDTLNVQRTQKSIIESRLGESVRKADLREAALLVGLQHTDDVVDVLEGWGYALE